MSRGFSFIALLLLGIAAFGLYQLSYEVQRLEDELVELNRALGHERETIGVLNAEWSYLSRPEYLQDRAVRLLDMKPTTAKHITRIEDLPWRQERFAPGQQPGQQPGQAPVQAPAAVAAATITAAPVAAASPVAARAAEFDADVAAVLGAMGRTTAPRGDAAAKARQP